MTILGSVLVCACLVLVGWWHCHSARSALDTVKASGGHVALRNPGAYWPSWLARDGWSLLTDVESIDLKGATLTPNVMRAVGALEPQELDISAGALTFELLNELPASPRLRRLWLTHTPTTDSMLEVVSQHFPNLVVLGLGRTWITNAGVTELPKLPQLAVLDLSGTAITDEAAESLSAMQGLRTLLVSDTKLGDAGIQHLTALPSLEILNLSGTSLSNDGVTALTKIQSLKKLNLSRTAIAGPCLGPLLRLVELRSLALDGTQADFDTEAGLDGFGRLAHLSLRQRAIGKAAIQDLQHCDPLQSLDLDRCEIHDAEFAQLSRLPNLRLVSARQTPLTDVSVEQVTRLCPKTSIRLGAARAQNVIRISDTAGDYRVRSSAHFHANVVVLMFEEWFGATPPTGTRPFLISRSKEAFSYFDPGVRTEYSISLKSLNSHARNPAILFRDLGHELGHVWISGNSDRNNGFAEAVCCSLSFLVLDEIARSWTTHYHPSARKWAKSCDNFREYAQSRVVEDAGLRSVDDIYAWVFTNKPRLASVWAYEQNLPCGILVEQILNRHRGAWGALTHVGSVLGEGEDHWRVDFKEWRSLVKPHEQALVDDLATAFAHLRLE